MYQIIFEKADNGVIKTAVDDNLNGNNVIQESKQVYQYNNDNDIPTTIKVLSDICKELNLPTGNINSNTQLHLFITWGSNYNPSNEEIQDRIAGLKNEILRLEGNLKNENKSP